MPSRTTLLILAVTILAPATGRAQWSTVGIARMPGSGAGCGEPLGPSQGELFAVGVNGGQEQPDAGMQYCIDGRADPTHVDWKDQTGAWQVTANWSYQPPNITITAYPDEFVSPLTAHRGLLVLDDEDREVDGWLQYSLAQEIPTVIVRPGRGVNHLAWASPTVTGVHGTCEVGPEDAPDILIGWNVYRLLRSDVPPQFSTPDHYLCGPDADCTTTADNGFVAFVPHAPSPTDGQLHYDDAGLDPDPALSDFVYVVQPVKRRSPLSPLGDANADGIPDEDLNGDGIPEFVDPAGQRRGLTARIPVGPAWRKPILIGPDSVTAHDVIIYVNEESPGYRVYWDALGGSASSDGHDLHAGFFSDWRDPVAFAARDRLACDLPDGPSNTPLVDPRFAVANRYYLMSVAWSAGTTSVEEYGTDSFGVEHPATTTPPPCR